MSDTDGLGKIVAELKALNPEQGAVVEELFRNISNGDHPAAIEASDAIRDVMRSKPSSMELAARMLPILRKLAGAFGIEH